MSIDVIQAVAARRPTRPADYAARVQAVAAFKEREEAEALAAGNKRVANILAKQEGNVAGSVDTTLLQEDAEKALYEALEGVQAEVKAGVASQDYNAVLSALATLREAVDNFFDNVMVMAEDESVRNNRLALLSVLRQQFLETADISLLTKQ